ncbi:MAG: caspase family protein [Muribaculaceae bacterium]|nr:caspase family protein [Muribaculaceae bacterium]
MTKRFLILFFAAAVAAMMAQPMAAESLMMLDHNPYGYSIVRKDYHDIALDRYGNVYATEKSLNCNSILFIDDECIVFSRGYDYVFAGHDGKEIEKVDYINAKDLCERGYCYAKNHNNLWGIIDKRGKWIIEPSAKDLEKAPFTLSRYHYIKKKDDATRKWGIINTEGEWAVQPQFKSEYDIYPLDENSFAAKQGGKWGKLDTQGNWIVQPQYKKSGDVPRNPDRINETDYIKKTNLAKNKVLQSGNYFYIRTPATLREWMELAVMPWDVYSKGKLNNLEPLEQFLKRKIEPEINAWQKKGEFESTAEWQKRVNERTRQAKIDALSKTYKAEYSKMLEKHKKDYAKVVEDYKKYYNKQFDLYVDTRIKDIGFSNDKLTLSTYDADNQSYMISTGCSIGDILLPVPVAEAKKFKEKWNDEFRRYAKLHYVPSGDDMVLTSVTFEDAYGKTYTYDSNTKAQYAVTDINYNFKPVEIALSDEEDVTYTFDPVEVIKQSVVHTSAPKSVGGKKADVQRKKVIAGTLAEVDKNIPKNPANDSRNTFAVIIANEDYTQVQPVEFAANDGQTFAKYCTQTLGIPEKRVFTLINATYGEILDAMQKLKALGEAYNGDMNVIFYYAGHGIPDESTKDAYLLPVDANGRSSAACYSLKKLIEELGSLGARTTTVFIDACFSGAKRDKGMLISARGVAIKPRDFEPQGNVVVFSATQNDETAMPYRDKNHGLFTYYLLKKLQDSKGTTTVGELSDYVTDRVRKASVEVNGKAQTPTVRTPVALSDTWRTWQLK